MTVNAAPAVLLPAIADTTNGGAATVVALAVALGPEVQLVPMVDSTV